MPSPCERCGGPKNGRPSRYCIQCSPNKYAGQYGSEPCVICGGPAPLDAKGRDRVSCDKPECRSALQRSLVARTSHVVERLRADLTGERACTACGKTFPFTIEFFPAGDSLRRMRAECRPCFNKKNAVRQRERYQAIKADPERYATRRANERIHNRAKRLEEGITPRSISTATAAYRVSAGQTAQAEGQPVEPLALWLEEVLANDHREHEEIAEVMGVADRSLRKVMMREYPRITLGSADAMIWGYGRAVRISPDRVERLRERIEAYWRSAPGNGERLLGYLDEAERIAHLPGAIVERVEDLWEDLRDE